MPLVLIASIAGIPALLSLLLRVNAVFVFLSIAAGNLLVLYLGRDAGNVGEMFIKGSNGPMIAQLAVLGLPLLLTFIFLRKTLPTSKILLHFLPVVASGIMLAALTLPILPSDLQGQVFGSAVGPYFKNSQGLIVGAASVLTLLLTWFTYRSREDHSGKKHH